MTEILYHRANTEAFILADPVAITLKFREKIDLPSGGFKWGPETAREEQSFKMIPQTDVMPTVTTPDGVTLLPGYVILGRYDAVMERWDKFTLHGVEYQIVSPIRPDVKDPSKIYERKADVARL